jgi:hypothetical protein
MSPSHRTLGSGTSLMAKRLFYRTSLHCIHDKVSGSYHGFLFDNNRLKIQNEG